MCTPLRHSGLLYPMHVKEDLADPAKLHHLVRDLLPRHMGAESANDSLETYYLANDNQAQLCFDLPLDPRSY